LFEFLAQGGSDMTGTDCLQFTHKKSRSYLNHLVFSVKYTCSIHLTLLDSFSIAFGAEYVL